LFTNLPVDEALQVIRNKLQNDHRLTERPFLEVEAIMELREGSLTTSYFQVYDKSFQQEDGMAMRISLFSVVSNIFMKHFEEMALGTANHRTTL
jgi:hypothetical protein